MNWSIKLVCLKLVFVVFFFFLYFSSNEKNKFNELFTCLSYCTNHCYIPFWYRFHTMSSFDWLVQLSSWKWNRFHFLNLKLQSKTFFSLSFFKFTLFFWTVYCGIHLANPNTHYRFTLMEEVKWFLYWTMSFTFEQILFFSFFFVDLINSNSLVPHHLIHRWNQNAKLMRTCVIISFFQIIRRLFQMISL